MRVEPYLFFEGRCDEAIAFYRKALGAEVTMLMRFKDSPEPPAPGMCPPGSQDKVMHANLRIGDTMVMVSDGRCQGKPGFQGLRCRSPCPTMPQPNARSRPWPARGKCRCRLPRPSFRRASAWSR